MKFLTSLQGRRGVERDGRDIVVVVVVLVVVVVAVVVCWLFKVPATG